METRVRPVTVSARNFRHELPEEAPVEVGGALERLIAQEFGGEPYALDLNATWTCPRTSYKR